MFSNLEIKLGYYDDGRSTGDAIVEFSTMAEAREALQKDKQLIGSRFIIKCSFLCLVLFLNLDILNCLYLIQ